MYKKLFMTAALVAACLQTNAQTLATEFKTTSEGNPISGNIFCADPTALEYNGRLYVYGSNDHQQFIANGKKGENTYGEIKSIVVFSTDDMVNWTFHGTIDTKKICSGWTPSVWYKGYGVSWAPSVTWRYNNRTKKDEFFLYFCNSSHGVGVLKADSPIGPWKSPLTELMIHYDTPGANPLNSNANFDPGVTIDENGVGWISFGGLGPSQIMPNAARIVKLKSSMTAVDGSAVVIPAPYHFEANELNVMDGKFVYTYCSNWAERTDADWDAYKAEHGINAPKPNSCTMCYMVSDDPTNPNSWVYKGVYGPHPGMGTNNNHSHLQKFKNEYYYLYHGAPLMEKMRSAGIIDNNCGTFRSICVNKATVNEATQTITPVSPDLTGTSVINGGMNPYVLQEAETMATCGGIEYEDYTNITKNTSVSTLGNEASQNIQVRMKEGSWSCLRSVNFGTSGASKIMVRAKGEGTIEIRIGRKGAKNGAAIFNIASSEMTDYTVDVDPTKFNGQKNIFIIASSGEVYVDAWQATDSQPSGIQNIDNNNTVTTQRYDLSGRRISNSSQHRGIVIEQYTDRNGVKHTRKTM